jgi:DNA modification methylase
MSEAVLYCGDVRDVLARLQDGSVQCVVTSPPYWGLRDYGVAGQLGLEGTPETFVANMVAVFAAVRRVLRDDGVLWLNIGDSYCGSRGGPNGDGLTGRHETVIRSKRGGSRWGGGDNAAPGLKPKDLVGIPWMLAFALRADGWFLRSDVVWSKPNPMPESVRDRPTRAHEYVFLMSKSERYFYDGDAIRTPRSEATVARDTDPSQHTGPRLGKHKPDHADKRDPTATYSRADKQRGHSRRHAGFNDRWDQMEKDEQVAGGANARSVWTIAPQCYPEAHFATFPEELARRCILAGSKPGDTVLDPFGGSGTVAAVATGHGRRSIYIDLNPAYLELARQRIGPMMCQDAPLGAA